MQNHECSESSGEVLAWWPGCTEKEWPKESGCQGTASGGDDTTLRLKEEKVCICGQVRGHFRQSVARGRLRIHKIRHWVQVTARSLMWPEDVRRGRDIKLEEKQETNHNSLRRLC